MSKLIGELNGKWSFLFRVSLVLMPIFTGIIITWGTWVTTKVYAHDVTFAKVEAFMESTYLRTTSDNERYKELIVKIENLTVAMNSLRIEMATQGNMP